MTVLHGSIRFPPNGRRTALAVAGIGLRDLKNEEDEEDEEEEKEEHQKLPRVARIAGFSCMGMLYKSSVPRTFCFAHADAALTLRLPIFRSRSMPAFRPIRQS